MKDAYPAGAWSAGHLVRIALVAAAAAVTVPDLASAQVFDPLRGYGFDGNPVGGQQPQPQRGAQRVREPVVREQAPPRPSFVSLSRLRRTADQNGFSLTSVPHRRARGYVASAENNGHRFELTFNPYNGGIVGARDLGPVAKPAPAAPVVAAAPVAAPAPKAPPVAVADSPDVAAAKAEAAQAAQAEAEARRVADEKSAAARQAKVKLAAAEAAARRSAEAKAEEERRQQAALAEAHRAEIRAAEAKRQALAAAEAKLAAAKASQAKAQDALKEAEAQASAARAAAAPAEMNAATSQPAEMKPVVKAVEPVAPVAKAMDGEPKPEANATPPATGDAAKAPDPAGAKPAGTDTSDRGVDEAKPADGSAGRAPADSAPKAKSAAVDESHDADDRAGAATDATPTGSTPPAGAVPVPEAPPSAGTDAPATKDKP